MKHNINDEIEIRPDFKYLQEDGKPHYYPVIGGKKYSYVGDTEDEAMLIGLGIKYDGLNSQFAKMAMRMLNIESDWTE